MTRPRRCAQFAFQMRREERERAPLVVALYICTVHGYVCAGVWQEQGFVFSML